MMFTSLEHTTAGLAMGLSEPDGEFQLYADVLLVDPAYSDLQSAFVGFTDQAQHWREIVACGAQHDLATGKDLSNPAFLA